MLDVRELLLRRPSCGPAGARDERRKALIGQLSPLGKLSPTMEVNARENIGCRREEEQTGAPSRYLIDKLIPCASAIDSMSVE